MRLWHLTLLTLLSADPAQACHIYSVWHYHWPQHCAVARAAAPVEDRWYVEITRLPDGVEEDRAIGIEALKRALGDSQR
jgi:hypothetical protein